MLMLIEKLQLLNWHTYTHMQTHPHNHILLVIWDINLNPKKYVLDKAQCVLYLIDGKD